MRWRSSTDEADARAWFAGLLTFALTLVAVAVLALVSSGSAGARTLGGGPQASSTAVTVEAEAESEGGDEAAEGEEAPDYSEFEEEGEEGEADEETPDDCVLESTQVRASASEAQSRLRVQVSYTASEPAAVSVDYRIRGGKGTLRLGGKRLGLGYSGVLRDSEQLSKGELAKALAGREITVRVRVLGTPGYCRSYFTESLDDRSVAAHAVSWR